MVELPNATCPVWDPSSCAGTEACPPRCPRFVARDGTPTLVRPYEPDDRADLVAMYEAMDARSRTLGLPPGSPGRLREWLDSLVEDGWNLVVEREAYGGTGTTDGPGGGDVAGDGEDDSASDAATLGDVVGHLAVVPGDDPEPKFVVFVADGYRDRGVGSELVRQAIARAGPRGHRTLGLDVSKGNRRAVTVYENVGFEVVDRDTFDLTMRLPTDHPEAERTRLPPAER